MQQTRRTTRQSDIRRRRVTAGCVAVLAVAVGGWALAGGSGGAAPAQPIAPNGGSYAPDSTPQRGVAVQPSQR